MRAANERFRAAVDAAIVADDDLHAVPVTVVGISALGVLPP